MLGSRWDCLLQEENTAPSVICKTLKIHCRIARISSISSRYFFISTVGAFQERCDCHMNPKNQTMNPCDAWASFQWCWCTWKASLFICRKQSVRNRLKMRQWLFSANLFWRKNWKNCVEKRWNTFVFHSFWPVRSRKQIHKETAGKASKRELQQGDFDECLLVSWPLLRLIFIANLFFCLRKKSLQNLHNGNRNEWRDPLMIVFEGSMGTEIHSTSQAVT